MKLEDVSDERSGRPAHEILGRMAAAIHGARSFLISSHVNPDGDALGSTVGLALGLRALGKDARVLIQHEMPAKYRPLLSECLIDVVQGGVGPSGGASADWVIVLDASEPSRLGTVEPVFFTAGRRRMCLDHHPSGLGSDGRRPAQAGQAGDGLYELELVLPSAPATGCLVLRLLDALGVEIDGPIAQALWIAIATDTGWFRFANTSAEALSDASRLAAKGLDVEALYEHIYGTQSPAHARLAGEVLARLETAFDGALVWSVLSLGDRQRHGLAVSELDGVVDLLKSIEGARIAAFVVELEAGRYKVSLRALGAARVADIARRFGGGGHDKAAGYRYDGPLERLLADLRDAVLPGVHVGRTEND